MPDSQPKATDPTRLCIRFKAGNYWANWEPDAWDCQAIADPKWFTDSGNWLILKLLMLHGY